MRRADGSAPFAGPPSTDPPFTDPLFTDLYELTMLRSYAEHGMDGTAVFDLFVRTLPPERNYLVACGLDDVLGYLEALAFSPQALDALEGFDQFPRDFREQLASLRFTGDVYAMAEGTPVFGGEPIIEVVAPLPEAQLVETYLINQVHFQTMIASKGARVVDAAGGRPVTDFGSRRAHGTDAAMKAARALYIAGVAATSNVLAGARYGIPVAGTMAHSFVQVHESEAGAFRSFVETHPQTVLLVDTYDTLEGVRAVIRLAEELGDAFAVTAIRLDSGDLAVLARDSRALLDAAGLEAVGIVVSGGLDEHSVAALVEAGAPIVAFGVGTRLGVSADAPYLDAVYKLVEYDGHGTLKLSTDKETLPGRKQVFRVDDGTHLAHDVLALHDEAVDGEPLLRPVMRAGRRLPAGEVTLDESRAHAAEQHQRLPPRLRELTPAESPFAVGISAGLAAERDRIRRDLGR